MEETGQGVPIILLHGYPLDHSIWWSVIPFLTKIARIITPDLRGQGQSDAPETICTMDLIADDIAGLMDALEFQKGIIIGHSMGGYASLAFARRYPSRTAGLGLVASHSRADTPEGRKARMESVNQIKKDGMAEIAHSMPEKLTRQIELWPMLQKLIQATNPKGAINALQAMAGRPDSIKFLADIKIPSLVVAGGSDSLIPIEKAKETARKMQNGKLVVIPTAGHIPMLEYPVDTAHAIAGLIDRVKANE